MVMYILHGFCYVYRYVSQTSRMRETLALLTDTDRSINNKKNHAYRRHLTLSTDADSSTGCPLDVIICHHLLSAVIRYHQLLTAGISCHQFSSAIISCHQLSSAVDRCHQLLSALISCHQLSISAISFHQLSSAIITPHQLLSAIIRRHKLSSDVIGCHPLSSAVISSHQLSSAVISCNQRLSTVISSHQLSSTFIHFLFFLGIWPFFRLFHFRHPKLGVFPITCKRGWGEGQYNCFREEEKNWTPIFLNCVITSQY